jgi:hypothetical protein
MKKLLLVGVVLVAASNANADKVVRALPNVYVGNWCGDDSNELHKCKDGDHVAIRVERHSYVVPEPPSEKCEIRKITESPDHWYEITATCLDTKFARHKTEHSVMHLAGEVLRWNFPDLDYSQAPCHETTPLPTTETCEELRASRNGIETSRPLSPLQRSLVCQIIAQEKSKGCN